MGARRSTSQPIATPKHAPRAVPPQGGAEAQQRGCKHTEAQAHSTHNRPPKRNAAPDTPTSLTRYPPARRRPAAPPPQPTSRHTAPLTRAQASGASPPSPSGSRTAAPLACRALSRRRVSQGRRQADPERPPSEQTCAGGNCESDGARPHRRVRGAAALDGSVRPHRLCGQLLRRRAVSLLGGVRPVTQLGLSPN